MCQKQAGRGCPGPRDSPEFGIRDSANCVKDGLGARRIMDSEDWVPTRQSADSPSGLDDGFDASPAIVGNEIYLRGHTYLYAIAEE